MIISLIIPDTFKRIGQAKKKPLTADYKKCYYEVIVIIRFFSKKGIKCQVSHFSDIYIST